MTTIGSGALYVDKPIGPTSFDVVARVRRAVGVRRVGHAGTLDPMASGLLVVAIGPATRLLRFAQSGTKRYRGVVRFGESTDTLDADGVVVGRVAVPELSVGDVAAAAASFVGERTQVPPMVSALKVNGRRLYEMARAGEEVERAPRPVRIDSFTVASTERPDEWSFVVDCSPGTYVRVLASDLAESLGTLGHLTALRRLASGAHSVDDALDLDEIDRRAGEGTLRVRPPVELVADLERVALDDGLVARVRQGQRVDLPGTVGGPQVAVVDERGSLVAVVERRGDQWGPTVVLPEDGDR